MNTKDAIDRICSERKARRDGLNAEADRLMKWEETLKALIKISIHLDRIVKGKELIKIQNVKHKCECVVAAISKVLNDKNSAINTSKHRLSRDYVNIGIAAPWRHGKSLFLQTLFDLDESIKKYLIPVDNNQNEACTGTTVHYVNSPNRRAEITYFTRSEILSSVRSLIQKLLDDETNPTYRNELGNCLKSGSISELISEIKNTSYYLNRLHKPPTRTFEAALKEYVDGYGDSETESNFTYGGLIASDGSSPAERSLSISFTEDTQDVHNLNNLKFIFERICFYKAEGNRDTHNNFKCLAVKEVTIYMPLAHGGVGLGNIRFVDTPGIGEKRTEVESNLCNILRSDIDLVIAICRTDKANAEEFNKFNEFLREDFNVEFVDDSGMKKDATGCIFYVINCVSEQPYLANCIYQAEDACIIKSLASGSKPINLPKAQIGIFDIWSAISFGLDGNRKAVEVNKKSEYKLTMRPHPTVSIDFLGNCLNAIGDVGAMDAYFLSEANKEFGKIEKEYIDIIETLSELRLEYADGSNLNFYMQQSIADGINDISPCYSADDSEKKIKGFLSEDEHIVVARFVALKDSLIAQRFGDNLKETLYEDPAKTGYGKISEQDVIEAVGKSDKFLSYEKYVSFMEFAAYTDIRRRFSEFVNLRLSKCLNVAEITASQKKCGIEIIKVLSSHLSPAFGKKDLPAADFVEHMHKHLNGKSYGKSLLEALDDLLNPKGCTQALKDYVQKTLTPSYHHETPAGGIMSSFQDVDNTRKTYAKWLINITHSVFTKIGAQEVGVESFGKLITGIKQAYINEVLSPLWQIDGSNAIACDLREFISRNSDALHHIDAINGVIDSWNQAIDNIVNEYAS